MHTLLRTLCPRAPDPYRWKAEDLSFLHVLLVLDVNLGILLNKKRQSSSCVSFEQILDTLQIH